MSFTFSEIYNYLIALLIAGTGMRILYCLLHGMGGDDTGQYRQRAINAAIFMVIGVVAFSLVRILWSTYGGGVPSFDWFRW